MLTGWEIQNARGGVPPEELLDELELLLELLELLELPAPELLLELDEELDEELELLLELELELLDEVLPLLWPRVLASSTTGAEALPLASIARRV